MRITVGLFVLTITLAACGPVENPNGGGGATDASTEGSCSGNEVRCVGASYQVCQDGAFVEQQACVAECSESLGCVECDPARGTSTCLGDAVHQCNPDGTVGTMVEVCEADRCSNGSCVASDCAAGAELIYVVSANNEFLSFDPRNVASPGGPFTMIGNLSCTTQSPPYPGYDANPFSMSVDRDARAWVLYSTGEIFHVSTRDASCQSTTFARGQQGFELFGMGFVSDTPGSSVETLYIAGGAAGGGSIGIGDLGRVDKNTMQVTRAGSLPQNLDQYSPELTGTGDAELYAYYPGVQDIIFGDVPSLVARVSKQSATHEMMWNLPSLNNSVSGWAFAHWGGEFYIFVSTGIQPFNSQVIRFNRETGQATTLLSNQPYRIVGAGVSTCAPIVID